MLPNVLKELEALGFTHSVSPLVVDCGCGQLRNTHVLLSLSSRLVLVDTACQLESEHNFLGEKMRVAAYVKRTWPEEHISVMSVSEFNASRLQADVVFSINVLDVVPAKTRAAVLRASLRNLRDGGIFVAVVPRNDGWTLRICTPQSRYNDGYIFPHAHGYTYYRNWSGDSLALIIKRHGFRLVKDLSIYRQVCLLGEK
jgi:SAM-dependent methyltransferase